MSTLTIRVNGTPAPQGSKRGFVVKGRVVMAESSPKVKPWRQDVAAAAAEAAIVALWMAPAGPIEVVTTFYLPRPRYHYRTGKHAGELKATAPVLVDKKPDLDKLVRATLDALTTAGVIRDDAQIAHMSAWKIYANNGVTGASVRIQTVDAR